MENFIVSTFVISVSLMTILNGQAVYNKAYLWPKGIVPYKISSRFSKLRHHIHIALAYPNYVILITSCFDKQIRVK